MNRDTSRSIASVPFRPVRSACRWKVGIDIGQATTVLYEVVARPGTRSKTTCSVLPTLVAYPSKVHPDPVREDAIHVGEGAERRRDRMEVFAPLALTPPRRNIAILDFLEGLRRTMGSGLGWKPWGVLASPPGAGPGRIRELRAMAGELFDRTLLVDEPLLIALAVLGEPAGTPVTVVDIGKTSVRAALVTGRSPGPEERVEIRGGGDAADAVLRRLLLEKYPDLLLTDLTVTRMKERLAFAGPAPSSAKVKLVLGRSHVAIDVTDIVRAAGEILVAGVVRAIRDSIDLSPPELVPLFLSNIVLAGGGAALRGLPGRVQEELGKDGHAGVAVRGLKDPRTALALGALKWALLTPDDAWEIPLFNYRPAV